MAENGGARPEAALIAALQLQGVAEGAAGGIVSAVLCALDQGISGDDSGLLARSFPPFLQPLVQHCERHRAGRPHLVGRRHFVAEVAEHLGNSPRQAERLAVIVLEALRRELSVEEVRWVAVKLPKELRTLWTPVSHRRRRGRRQALPVVTALEVFLQEVRTRGLPRGLTPKEAAAAAFCVVDQRLPGGLAARVQDQLALDLRVVPLACMVSPAAPAQAFGREEFLKRLAAHLERTEDEAEQAARSVFAAARHVLSARRLLREVDRALPHDIRPLWESDAVAPPDDGPSRRPCSEGLSAHIDHHHQGELR